MHDIQSCLIVRNDAICVVCKSYLKCILFLLLWESYLLFDKCNDTDHGCNSLVFKYCIDRCTYGNMPLWILLCRHLGAYRYISLYIVIYCCIIVHYSIYSIISTIVQVIVYTIICIIVYIIFYIIWSYATMLLCYYAIILWCRQPGVYIEAHTYQTLVHGSTS